MSLINTLIIAIALSMDTFSLSISISLLNNKKVTYFAFLVGIFHFIFPIIGSNIGNIILRYIKISPNKLLGIIFLFLFIKLLKDIITNKEEEIQISFLNILLLSILVSIDSLITGIGLINLNIFQPIIFSIISFSFTILGLLIGSSAKTNLENKSNILGLLLLFLLSVIHIIK